MNRIGILFLILLFATAASFAQGTAPSSTQSAAVGHGAFPVKVTKTLDSSKLKEGDTVELETSGSFKLPDGTLVPKGSKVEGHVTSAKARSKGDAQSQLTLAFDKLRISDGKVLSLKGDVQAVMPPYEEAAPMMAGKASGAAGGGYTGATVGTVTDSKSGSNMEVNGPAGNPQAKGVQGMHDLSLENGTLSSGGKNVKLGNGVRMIVRADILG